MFQNIPALKQAGFLYPFGVRRHTQLVHNLFSKTRTPEQISADLMERIQKHQVELHTVVISDEDLCMRRNLKLLAQFQKSFDVKIVFSLRRQDLWLESWHLQNIKWQWDPRLSHCDFNAFMAQQETFHWIHYDRYVRHLEELFGRENIILNVFEKQQMPEGPIKAFCDSIGLVPSDDFVVPEQVNSSFSPLISEFMRELPLGEAPGPYRRVLEQACAGVDARLHPKGHGSNLLLPHADRVAVMQMHKAGNRALAQRYFDRDELFLDALPGPEAELGTMSLPKDASGLLDAFVKPFVQELIAAEEQRNLQKQKRSAKSQKRK